jgi:hypothetical protein
MISPLRYPILYLLLAALLLGPGACAGPNPQAIPGLVLSPEEYVRQLYTNNSPPELRTVRILGRREWEKGVLVFLDQWEPGDGKIPGTWTFGYSLLERAPSGGGWQVVSGHLHGRSEPLPRSELVDWSIGSGGGMSGPPGGPMQAHLDPVVYYGRALTPEVRAVQVIFDDGGMRRDEAGDGMFAVVVPPTARACQLVVIGQADQVLRRINLPEILAGGAGVAQPDDCQSGG